MKYYIYLKYKDTINKGFEKLRGKFGGIIFILDNALYKNFNQKKDTNLIWTEIQKEMKSKFGAEIYESWLKKISFEELLEHMTKKLKN